MAAFLYILLLILLYLLPFIVIYYYKWINDQLRAARLKFKVPDLLNFYLIFGIFLFSPIAFSMAVFWIYILVIAVIAIILITNFAYIKKNFILTKFLRIWWRFVFLVSIVVYIVVGFVAIIRMIF